jgi:hypothetical protein
LKRLQGCKAEGQGVAEIAEGCDAEGFWCQGDSQWRQEENWPSRTFLITPSSAAKVKRAVSQPTLKLLLTIQDHRVCLVYSA